MLYICIEYSDSFLKKKIMKKKKFKNAEEKIVLSHRIVIGREKEFRCTVEFFIF